MAKRASFRKADSGDLDVLVDIYRQTFVPMVKGYHGDVNDHLISDEYLKSTWKALLEDSNTTTFFAVQEETDAPCALMTLRPTGDNIIELVKLYVLPEMQSTGLAKSFMEFGEKFAIEEGFDVMELWTWEVSHQSRRFYEKIGLIATDDRGVTGYTGIPPENDVTIRYEKRLHDQRTERLDWREIERLTLVVLDQICKSDWQPTVIVAMSRGGFIPATQIAVELGVLDLVGIDVQKDEDGTRTVGRFAALQNLDGQRVLIVDDGTVTGNLLQLTAEIVRTQGGDPRTCALVSEGQCDPPDYLAEIRDDISAFPWKQ